MKITLDRRLIDSLCEMSDERLWQIFYGITAGSGDISRRRPDYRRIHGFRALLEEATDEDIRRINELLEVYHSAKK